MAEFQEQFAFDLGRRIEIRGPYSWFAVLQPSFAATDPEGSQDDFLADLSSTLGEGVRVIRSLELPLEDLRLQLSRPASDTVLIIDLDRADDAYWNVLDVNRSGLFRPGAVVLWLSSKSLSNLCMHAPNLRSFIGGSIFQLGNDGAIISEPERAQRLADLESHFDISGSELVAQAESGTRPTDPHLVEWLVLLGRGDLI